MLVFAALTMNWFRIQLKWWEFALLALSVALLFRPGFFMDRIAPEFAAAPADQVYEVAKNLPYGAQRRLEIARALAAKPKLLLLDEPAAGMNPQETKELMDMIRWIRQEFGLTILLIEHDMSLVMGICERIYVLEYGQIIAHGVPEEIKHNPEVIRAYLGGEA